MSRRWPGIDAAVALLAVAAFSLSLAQHAGLGAAYPAKALGVALLWGGIGAWLVKEAAALTALAAADRITLARATLVMPLAALLGEPATAGLAALAVAIATVSAVLDAVDGWVARRRCSATAFGARFDMETDALLVLVLSLLAWQWERAGAWVLLAGLARYLFAASALMLPWMSRPLPRSRRRQSACAAIVIALIVCIAPWIPATVAALVAATGLITLLVSFAVDVHWLIGQAGDPSQPEGYPS